MDLFPNFCFTKFSPTLLKYVKNLAKQKLRKISHFLICSKLRKMSISYQAYRANLLYQVFGEQTEKLDREDLPNTLDKKI